MHVSLRVLASALFLLCAVTANAQVGSRAHPVAAPAAVPALAPGAMPKIASFTQGFDDITTLGAAGWFAQNNSAPIGSTNWFQGNPVSGGGPFNAQAGADNAYIGANYNNTGSTGTISNWLLTPELDFGGSSSFTFWTRTVGAGQIYPDRLEVRLSTSGASTNVGVGAAAVGDFTTLLLSVNPNLSTSNYPAGYPFGWTQFTLTNASGLPRSGTGRIAFRYYVTNAGLNGTNADYIGIDTVAFAAGAPEYQVGGSVSGLAGSGLALALNGGTPLAIAADGSFQFPDFIAQGGTYDVLVQNQPTGLSQTCSVTNGSGTVGGAVTNVQVNCVTDDFTIGGTTSGLAGTGLVLQNNAGDDLAIAADGAFVFSQAIMDGGSYAVTVAIQPSNPSQTCSVSDDSGVVSGSDVASVTVVCVTDTFSVGGTVSGLAAGNSVVLQNNGGDDVVVAADGGFTFPTDVPSGQAFLVTVLTQPDTPSQTCTVAAGAGTVGDADITGVAVTCITNSYSVGGTVGGLAAGNSVVLQNNGGDDLVVAADGAFTFPTSVPSGQAFSVTVLTQPDTPSQTCMVASGAGTVTDADIAAVTVTCGTDIHSVGGTVSGLAAGNSMVLQNNGGDDLVVAADGGFTFATGVASGQAFSVTVLTQPATPSQTCTVAGGAGTIADGDINDVAVTCATNSYSVGGTVSGLAAGNSVVLQNNGGDDLVVSANGGFTFAGALADDSPYAVTVLTHPSSPNQDCSVGNASGTLAGASVTDVAIICITADYPIGGSVSGLAGGSVVLQLNGGDTVTVGANGSFAFPTGLPDGSAYAVAVLTQPALPAPGQSCSVTNGSGTVAGAGVSTVQVTCADLADVPAAPTGVQGTASGADALTISWTAPDDNGATITGYTATVNPGGASCSTSGNPAPTHCVIDNLASGTYSIQVFATNAAGTSLAGEGTGVVQGVAIIQPQVIPALSQWTMLLMAAMAALLAMVHLRRA